MFRWSQRPQDIHQVTSADVAKYSLAVHKPLALLPHAVPANNSSTPQALDIPVVKVLGRDMYLVGEWQG
jgi:hypothetical protein